MWDMNTVSKLQIHSTDSDTTETLGANIGSRLRGGEVIELMSDLGGGKTTFTRGLVRGAGSEDHVSSPTFTVSKIYKSNKLRIHHFDLYRLHEAGIMAHEIVELQQDPENVLVLEWAGIADDFLTPDRLMVSFETTSENEREIVMSYPKTLAYLVESGA
jgi:tRNA threonylcarbamoyladenosine biosynthesis protein TsaE